MLHNQEKSLKEIPSLCRGKEAKGGGLGVKTCSCSPIFMTLFKICINLSVHLGMPSVCLTRGQVVLFCFSEGVYCQI